MLSEVQAPSNLRPQFDEPHLFEMYFLHRGSIPRMLDTINVLSQDVQQEYPKRPTLYEYEKKHNWKERYKKMHESVIKELESGVALHYDRINQIANLAAAGLAKRLVNALQSNDETAMRVFTSDMFKHLWEIQRTERGLPMTITKKNMTFSGRAKADDALRSAGLGHVADAIDQASPEKLMAMLEMMGGARVEIPAIIQ